MSYKVLVVDSEPAVRGYIMDILSSEGYLCQTADDVKVTARLITEDDYDVVLLDVTVLDKPNFELLEQIKRRDKDTIVVILSPYSNITNATDAVKKGAYDFISKPYNAKELRARVDVGRRMVELQSELVKTRDALAYQAAVKQARKYDTLEWADFRRKMNAFLARRGFNYETAKSAVEQVWEARDQQPK